VFIFEQVAQLLLRQVALLTSYRQALRISTLRQNINVDGWMDGWMDGYAEEVIMKPCSSETEIN